MQRKFILLSSSFLFLAIGIALIIIGAGEKNSMMPGLFSASITFIFVSYWNFYSYRIEKIIGSDGEYFTYGNSFSGGIGISYNKTTVVPFFLVLFISVSLAIVTFFLAVDRSTEDFAVAAVILSFILSTIVTIYFSLRINRELKKTDLTDSIDHQNPDSAREKDIGKINDDIAVKIAFIFASVATLGLFPLLYFLVKKARGIKQEKCSE